MAITNRTTVKQLSEMGVSIEDLNQLIEQSQKKQERLELLQKREEFAEEVFQIMLENPEAEWKNGHILKHFFPEGKSTDEEVEKSRVRKHAEISRALQALTESGRIVKVQGKTTALTHYKVENSVENEVDEG